MKKRRKKYTVQFKRDIVARLRASGMSGNRFAKTCGIDQSSLSKWSRQVPIENSNNSAAPIVSSATVRTRRDSAETLSTLMQLQDTTMPGLTRLCAQHVRYSKMTAGLRPTGWIYQEEWEKLFVELHFVFRDLEVMSLNMRVDNVGMHQIYLQMIAIKDRWLSLRSEMTSVGTADCNNNVQSADDDYGISEERTLFDQVISRLRSLVISSRSTATN